jgi:GGDEF domain-containing protein
MVILVLWLALLFNLERLNLGSTDTLNLPTATYIIGLVVAVAPLLPLGARVGLRNLFILAAVAYAVANFIAPGPALGGVLTYMTLAGLLLVLATAAIAHAVAQGLDEFHQGVETVALAGAGPWIPSVEEASQQIEVELDRTRRVEHPISVLKLRIDPAAQTMLVHRFVEEITRSLVQRYATTAVAQVAARCLRRNNFIVAEGEPGQLLIISPETNAEQVPVLAERVRQAVSEHFAFTPQLAFATLPTDALTFDDLRSVIDSRLASPQPAAPNSRGEISRAEPHGASD